MSCGPWSADALIAAGAPWTGSGLFSSQYVLVLRQYLPAGALPPSSAFCLDSPPGRNMT